MGFLSDIKEWFKLDEELRTKVLCNSWDHHFLGIHVNASPRVMQMMILMGLIYHTGLLPILIFEKLWNFF